MAAIAEIAPGRARRVTKNLDEPTSSLDPEAEAAIFAELKQNLRGRVGIVISHRFSTRVSPIVLP